MLPLISDPFPLLPFLHVDFHKAVAEQNFVNPVVRDINSMCFFDFLFQMDWAQVVSVIAFENQFFLRRVNSVRFSTGLFESGRTYAHPFKKKLERIFRICKIGCNSSLFDSPFSIVESNIIHLISRF